MSSTLHVAASDLPAEQLLRQTGVLAVVDFDPALQPLADPRHLVTPLMQLAGPKREVWSVDGPVETNIKGGLRYASSPELTMGMLEVPLGDDIAASTQAAYQQLLRFLGRQPHPHLLRCWNYFSGITQGVDDQERYRQFVLGRYQAFASHGLGEGRYPAATAIGGPSNTLFLMFMATAQRPAAIENPRQTSAFAYPRQYGPRSPSFARAVQHHGALLVSGTASVVGHRSRHDDDWHAQLDEILTNLQALCEHHAPTARPLCLRLYLREGLPSEAVIAALRQKLSASIPLIVLRGDICRDDLLLEIEGVWAR